MFFEKKGMELIGKSAATLRKHYEPTETPPEISACIGYKFSFVVRVLSKKSVRTADPSFEVVMIKERFQKETIIPTTTSSVALSTSSLADINKYKDLPLLVPITSTQVDKQVLLHLQMHILIHVSNFQHHSQN